MIVCDLFGFLSRIQRIWRSWISLDLIFYLTMNVSFLFLSLYLSDTLIVTAMATFLEPNANKISSRTLKQESQRVCWKCVFLFIRKLKRKIFRSGSLFRFALLHQSAPFPLTCPCILCLRRHLFPPSTKIRTNFFSHIPATSFFSLYNSGFSMVDLWWAIFGLCTGSYMHHCNPIVIVLIFLSFIIEIAET